VTNLDVSTAERAAAAEHWYRHRTQIENIFRDTKHGGALRHLPSGYPQINRAWMWRASHIPDTGPNRVRPGMEDDQCESVAASSVLNSRTRR
jgi:hypothetical protein